MIHATTGIRNLPQELLLGIFAHCDTHSKCQLALVCRLFKNLSEDNALWKRDYEQRWRAQVTPRHTFARQWKHYFARAHAIQLQAPENGQLLFYWSRGIPVATLGSSDNSFAVTIAAILGSQNCPHTPLSTILISLESDPQRAKHAYLLHRQDFINNSPILGAWLYQLLQSHNIEIEQVKAVYFPNFSKRQFSPTLQFLRGVAIFWMEQKREQDALITLHIIKLLHQKFAQFHSSIDLPFFKIIYDVLTTKQASSSVWEKFADILSDLSPGQLPIEAYLSALRTNVCLPLHATTRIASKLVKALLAKDLIVDDSIAIMPLKILEKFNVAHTTLANMIELALLYQFEQYYTPLRKVALLPHYQSQFSLSAAKLYSPLMELCIRLGDVQQALAAWLCLCRCQDIEHIDYQRVYALLDSSLQARDELISINELPPLAMPAKAYAYYQKGMPVEALRVINQCPFMDLADLEWLGALSGENINAAIIYSLFIGEEYLEDYYVTLADCHLECARLLYHNLAVRFYFEGNLDKSQEYAEFALDPACTPDGGGQEPETRALLAILEATRATPSAPDAQTQESLLFLIENLHL